MYVEYAYDFVVDYFCLFYQRNKSMTEMGLPFLSLWAPPPPHTHQGLLCSCTVYIYVPGVETEIICTVKVVTGMRTLHFIYFYLAQNHISNCLNGLYNLYDILCP